MKRYPTRNIFKTENVHTTKFGIESLAYFGPKIWEIVPSEMKEIKQLSLFKESIKSWIPKNCPCKLCAMYIQNIGYLTVA